MERDVLLVRHREHHVRAPAVLQLHQLGDPVAAAALPELGRVQHRHQHLLRADRVHLLAHDLDDLLVHAPARRQPGPEPGAELPDHARADEQLVGERLGVGRRLLLGREDVAGETCHAAAEPRRRVQWISVSYGSASGVSGPSVADREQLPALRLLAARLHDQALISPPRPGPRRRLGVLARAAAGRERQPEDGRQRASVERPRPAARPA